MLAQVSAEILGIIFWGHGIVMDIVIIKHSIWAPGL